MMKPVRGDDYGYGLADKTVSAQSAIRASGREFAAKVRAARAVLGWSQAELAARIGVTQRTVNRLEHSNTDVRRSTAVAVEKVLQLEGIDFKALPRGGFQMIVANERGLNQS